MSRKHFFAPALLFKGDTENNKPAVPSWVTCKLCGTQACMVGYGNKGRIHFRADSNREWSEQEPACKPTRERAIALVIGVAEGDKRLDPKSPLASAIKLLAETQESS